MPDHVLVAYDESAQAEAALRYALETFDDADITVLHVTDPREWFFPDPMEAGYYSEEGYDRAQEQAKRQLERAEQTAVSAGRTVETDTTVGTPGATIVEYAEAHDVDHIVLGSHGRRGLARFLLGSVAETVARRSPTSVTIIRNAKK